jgi:hypothetical protein
MIVLIMGVSGSGKTTVGQHLAQKLGCSFAEGDAFHPPQNLAKMRSGRPLDDADREPWLLSIAEQVDAAIAAKLSLVGRLLGAQGSVSPDPYRRSAEHPSRLPGRDASAHSPTHGDPRSFHAASPPQKSIRNPGGTQRSRASNPN